MVVAAVAQLGLMAMEKRAASIKRGAVVPLMLVKAAAEMAALAMNLEMDTALVAAVDTTVLDLVVQAAHMVVAVLLVV
jgi:hypothetical protein